jgi:putative SOS response-associated peptidase YedK
MEARRKVANSLMQSLGEPTAFAGLWEGFRWPDGKVLRTFTIITSYANEIIGELHDRMPVILEPPDWPTWLGEVEGDPSALMRPAGEDVLKVWPVKRVDSPRNNDWKAQINPPSQPFVGPLHNVRDRPGDTMADVSE